MAFITFITLWTKNVLSTLVSHLISLVKNLVLSCKSGATRNGHYSVNSVAFCHKGNKSDSTGSIRSVLHVLEANWFSGVNIFPAEFFFQPVGLLAGVDGFKCSYGIVVGYIGS